MNFLISFTHCLYFWGKIQKIVCTSEGKYRRSSVLLRENTEDRLYFWGKYTRLSVLLREIQKIKSQYWTYNIACRISRGKKETLYFPQKYRQSSVFPSEVQMIFCIFPQKYRWSCVISLRSTDNEYKKFAKKAYFSLLKTKMIKIIYEKFDFFKVHSPP